ncbi:hypothetical protein EDB80DRAFT_709834 [Ilyonectria destructans]|nr:hypothetical protein EDB80DRAFT_709834 [Ilyonectria destructans]
MAPLARWASHLIYVVNAWASRCRPVTEEKCKVRELSEDTALEKLRDITPGGRPSAIADDLWCLRSHDDLLVACWGRQASLASEVVAVW